MLVHKASKKLLLNLSDAERITAIVPGAKTVNIKGHDIVSVNHDLDTVRVLRNMGIKAPSPVLSYYKWSGQYTPFAHQLETVEFLTLNPRSFVLNDLGTGKSLSALWAYDYLRKIGAVDWCLVVSPLSTLERVWCDEVFRHFPDMSYAALHGTAERRMKMAKDKYDFYVINFDGLRNKRIVDIFNHKPGTGMVIIDELATLRHANTERWKAANRLINGNAKEGIRPMTWVVGMTGTPLPSEPTDAFAQIKLITPTTAPKFFGAFRDSTMRQVTQFKWAARPEALDIVHKLMQPSIRFKREDCIDLPETTYIEREVVLTAEQAHLYKKMMADLKAEFKGGAITASNEAVKLGRLLQICVGAAYAPDGAVSIPAKPRVDETIDLIEQSGGKTIVFVPFVGALEFLATELRKHYTVSIVHGGVPKRQRDDIFHDFMQPSGAQVLVAQPACMSHGLSLTSASTIIWFGPTTSSDTFVQANARIVRPGQKLPTVIAMIEGSPVERKLYDRLKKRESVQNVLLDMFE